MAIPIARWRHYEAAVRKVKRKYGLETAEIHSAYIPRPVVEQQHIKGFVKMSFANRRTAVTKLRKAELLRLNALPKCHKQYQQTKKNHRQTEAYIHLTEDERMGLLFDLAGLVAQWQDVRLFADCVDKVHFDSLGWSKRIDEEAFIQVVSRFEQYLKIYSKTTRDAKCGIIVHDNNPTMSERLGSMMKEFQEKGTLWTSIKHIIEAPFFVDSKAVNMIQLADLCSYALSRYVENREEKLFEKIFSKADRKDGRTVGVRHFTAQPCNCIICSAHKFRSR